MLTSRRNILKAMLAVGLAVYSQPYISALAKQPAMLTLPNFKKISLEQLDFKIFENLSKMVSLQSSLDLETTKKMFEVFKKEPWGKEHIVQLYNKLGSAIANPKKQIEELNAGEKWFADHLLTTWYLGIYYHEKMPDQRITFEHALMYQVVKDIVPVPFLEAEGYGTWEEPPKTNRYE